MLTGLLANSIYVRVRKNQFCVRSLESAKEVTFDAPSPFTTTGLLAIAFVGLLYVGVFDCANSGRAATGCKDSLTVWLPISLSLGAAILGAGGIVAGAWWAWFRTRTQ